MDRSCPSGIIMLKWGSFLVIHHNICPPLHWSESSTLATRVLNTIWCLTISSRLCSMMASLQPSWTTSVTLCLLSVVNALLRRSMTMMAF
ncbi:hypothetical protein ACHAW6_002333 [Cyclotella cf. meneghiniana]